MRSLKEIEDDVRQGLTDISDRELLEKIYAKGIYDTQIRIEELKIQKQSIQPFTESSQLPSFNLEKYLEEVHRLSFENMGNAYREYLKKEGHPCDKCNCHVNEEKK